MPEIETHVAEEKSTVERLTDHVSEYVGTYLELTSLKATQKATAVVAFGFTAVLISFFGMIIFIFLGFGLAATLSESMTLKEGFFLVALVYTVIGGIIIAFRKQLIFPFLRNKIVTNIYDAKD